MHETILYYLVDDTGIIPAKNGDVERILIFKREGILYKIHAYKPFDDNMTVVRLRRWSDSCGFITLTKRFVGDTNRLQYAEIGDDSLERLNIVIDDLALLCTRHC